uniref:Uncharacterized protein n=1 Tax=Anguilla anguilla TaxID=7936 RepID=A0A0E9SCQ5_ANGAN
MQMTITLGYFEIEAHIFEL